GENSGSSLGLAPRQGQGCQNWENLDHSLARVHEIDIEGRALQVSEDQANSASRDLDYVEPPLKLLLIPLGHLGKQLRAGGKDCRRIAPIELPAPRRAGREGAEALRRPPSEPLHLVVQVLQPAGDRSEMSV